MADPTGRKARVSGTEETGTGTGERRAGARTGPSGFSALLDLHCGHAFPCNSNSRPTHFHLVKLRGFFMTGQQGLLNCGTLRALWVLEGRVGVTQLKRGWALLPCGWVEEAVPGFCLELRNPQERQPRGGPHGASFYEGLSSLGHCWLRL